MCVPTYRSQAFVMSDGRVRVVGEPTNGAHGMGDSQFTHARPFLVCLADTSIGAIQEVQLTYCGTHALTASGALLGWGFNGQGQVGDGTTIQRNIPTAVKWPPGPAPTITKIASTGPGSYDTNLAWYAIDSLGRLWSWGWNGYGQLGLGDQNSQYYKPQLTSLTNVVSITGAGGYYGCAFAITGNGNVYAAGFSTYGQTGLGTNHVSSWTLVPLPGPCTKVACTGFGSHGHTLFLLADGRVFWCGVERIWSSRPRRDGKLHR